MKRNTHTYKDFKTHLHYSLFYGVNSNLIRIPINDVLHNYVINIKQYLLTLSQIFANLEINVHERRIQTPNHMEFSYIYCQNIFIKIPLKTADFSVFTQGEHDS